MTYAATVNKECGQLKISSIMDAQSKCLDQPNYLIGRVFTNGSGGWGSIPGLVIPKTQKMVLDTPLLNSQHYKVQIKGK